MLSVDLNDETTTNLNIFSFHHQLFSPLASVINSYKNETKNNLLQPFYLFCLSIQSFDVSFAEKHFIE